MISNKSADNEWSDSQMQNVSEAVLMSMTEEEMADWCREQGARVVFHRGRYWQEVRAGFYQPIHLMARLSIEQATRPTQLCWGFRAALCEEDVGTANGSMPVHLLSNVESYGLQSFSSNRRSHIRKCHKLVQIVQVIDSALLQEQGYEVLFSSITRTAYGKLPSQKEYLANLTDYVTPGRRLVLAGLIDNKLGGYLTGYAVSGTAYIESVHVATKVLTTNISSGLLFEFVQICRRSGEIHEVVHSLHTPEDVALGVFKEGMGFPVKHIPTKVQMNPIVDKFIRWRRPPVYYRLTGHIDKASLVKSKPIS